MCRFALKACVLLVPLLGLTWLFGLLSPLHIAFAYIFTIFNSTQVMFLFAILGADAAQDLVKYSEYE